MGRPPRAHPQLLRMACWATQNGTPCTCESALWSVCLGLRSLSEVGCLVVNSNSLTQTQLGPCPVGNAKSLCPYIVSPWRSPALHPCLRARCCASLDAALALEPLDAFGRERHS